VDGAAEVRFGVDRAGLGLRGGPASDALTGTPVADRMAGGRGDDALEGEGGADVLSGGAGDDDLAVGDASFVRVDGGRGEDTLRVASADGGRVTLDLDALRERVRGVEILDLTGAPVSLGLSSGRVRRLPSQGAQMVVIGDADDVLASPRSAWRDAGEVVWGGVPAHRYVDGAATLVVVGPVTTRLPPAAVTVQLSVPENAATGTVVGPITGADPDGVVTDLRVRGGDPFGAFRYDTETGLLVVEDGSQLDFRGAPHLDAARRAHGRQRPHGPVGRRRVAGGRRRGAGVPRATGRRGPARGRGGRPRAHGAAGRRSGHRRDAALRDRLRDPRRPRRRLRARPGHGCAHRRRRHAPGLRGRAAPDGPRPRRRRRGAHGRGRRRRDPAGRDRVCRDFKGHFVSTRQSLWRAGPVGFLGSTLAQSLNSPAGANADLAGYRGNTIGIDVQSTGNLDVGLNFQVGLGEMNASVPVDLSLGLPDQLPAGGSFVMTSAWALNPEARIWGRTPQVTGSLSFDFSNVTMGGVPHAIAGILEAIPFQATPRDTPLPPLRVDLPSQNFVGVPSTRSTRTACPPRTPIAGRSTAA
jgi:hypothetical protein